MPRAIFAWGLVLLLGVVSCTPGKQLSTLNDSAEAAFNTGRYADALQTWEQIINSFEAEGKSKECQVYGKAAQAALKLGQTKKAISYLESDQWSIAVNEETFEYMAKSYREIDNLSKEMDALETYTSRYPNGDAITEVKERLFETYVESENWDFVIENTDLLSAESLQKLSNMEGLFLANKAMKNDAACDALAKEMLAKDENNLHALNWLARKYYYKAENRYRDEMAAYEKKRTNKQYKTLLKALDVVTADFKTSLRYFKKVYSIDPSPKTAKFLGHIYGRLDDKKKEKYYKGLSGS